MEIYQTLKKDHQEVKSLFNELLSLNENDNYRHTLIDKIASELIPHARAEEAVFYNTLRACDADTGTIMHSFKEHMESETLLRTLQAKDKIDLDWKKTAIKLLESLEHHIQEEEGKVFALAKNILSTEEATQIEQAFTKLKAEYKNQGAIKNSIDMVINMLPARFANKVHDLNIKSHQ
jgi:hemerythrin superfamily protein